MHLYNLIGKMKVKNVGECFVYEDPNNRDLFTREKHSPEFKRAPFKATLARDNLADKSDLELMHWVDYRM